VISSRDPNDPLCEAYRRIRTYLKPDERAIGSLLVTSPGPEEGKSTTVVNLGISVAREGKRVAIVDLDLRRASLHKYFNLPNDVGLADLLQEKTPMDQAIQSTPVEGLSIIPTGPPFPDPGRLIESNQVGKLISELRTRFDAVILDSAPVLVKSDALVLAKCVDGAIIVLESEKTTRRAVHELMEVLAGTQVKPLGFVLNKFSVDQGKYFYHQHYYGHYARELPTR
jgi:capsular exopolysaccharide synthesis family protein